MDAVMYLKRLKKFTPEVALKALKDFLSESDSRGFELSVRNLNLVKNGIDDDRMIKYVVSTGYGLFQIVAVDSLSLSNKKERVSVFIEYSQI